jgi:very-short-patch-repair endonuclease
MDAMPRPGADELDWLMFEQSGVVTTSQAVALIGRAVVRRNLRQGRWRSVCRGVLSTRNSPLTRPQQLWAAVLIAGNGSRLAGPTAAAEGGVTGLRSEPLHVIVPVGRRPSAQLPRLPADMPAVRVHRTALPESHCMDRRPPRTTLARSAIDAAAWVSHDREAQAILAATCQQGRADPAEIRAVLTELPRVNRRKLIADMIADIEGGVDALSESDFLALCRRHHLPRPTLSRRRRDADGRLRFIDAYWPEHGLQVEIDGAHHMDARHWAADMLRQNQIWIAGDRILRFPSWLLRTDPTAVATQLRAALTSAPRASPRPTLKDSHN